MSAEDLQARVGRVEGLLDYYSRLRATPGLDGLMSLDDKAKLNGASATNAANTIVLRDAVGGVSLTGFSGGIHTAWAGVVALGNFANSWLNEPNSPGGEYRRDVLGFVHLRGVIYRSTGAAATNETIFTLPSGFRPTSSLELFGVITNTGAGQINIDSAGVVHWRSGGTGFLSLSGVRFEAVAV